MNDLLETTTELLAGVAAEQQKLTAAKLPNSRFLAVAHGGLATARENLEHEIAHRAHAAQAAATPKTES